MIRALWTSASGMQAQQTNLDVISHNIANVNTVGFKRSRANFEDLIYQDIKDVRCFQDIHTGKSDENR